MDMLPDFEFPKAPPGFKEDGIRMPKAGDWMVDYWGKPYIVTESSEKYWLEPTMVFKKK
jgi:hypothetical protein